MLGYQRSCPPYDTLFRTTTGGGIYHIYCYPVTVFYLSTIRHSFFICINFPIDTIMIFCAQNPENEGLWNDCSGFIGIYEVIMTDAILKDFRDAAIAGNIAKIINLIARHPNIISTQVRSLFWWFQLRLACKTGTGAMRCSPTVWIHILVLAFISGESSFDNRYWREKRCSSCPTVSGGGGWLECEWWGED